MNHGAKQFARWKACERKKRFSSAESAFQKGQQIYKCRYCGFWHRSGSFATFANQLSSVARPQVKSARKSKAGKSTGEPRLETR